MIRVRGSGWIGGAGFGAGPHADAVFHGEDALAERVASPPAGKASRNYGRFDLPTRLVCHAVELAFRDAYGSQPWPEGGGLVGRGDVGTLAANLSYYRDFCDHGKVLGRSNLFIYTLPTSPLAEAAIHFGLHGPLFFLGAGPDEDASDAFRAAADFIAAGAVPCMLVCDAMPRAVLVHLVEAGPGSEAEGIGAALRAADALRLIAAGQDGRA